MNYSIEELMPIVVMLAEKKTSKESSSISYEQANWLMEAVLYGINQLKNSSLPKTKSKLNAKEAYQLGYKTLISRIKETQELYNNMIQNFCAYENENYWDTVTKAIPGFFRYYDPQFAPQDSIITMDYRTILPVEHKTGIDAIQPYVTYLSYEQQFLQELPNEYVISILSEFQANYRKQFYNLSSIILRHILGKMILGKKVGTVGTKEEYELLLELIQKHDRFWIEARFADCLERLVFLEYDGDQLLKEYLMVDLKNFIPELILAAQYDKIKKVIVL